QRTRPVARHALSVALWRYAPQDRHPPPRPIQVTQSHLHGRVHPTPLRVTSSAFPRQTPSSHGADPRVHRRRTLRSSLHKVHRRRDHHPRRLRRDPTPFRLRQTGTGGGRSPRQRARRAHRARDGRRHLLLARRIARRDRPPHARDARPQTGRRRKHHRRPALAAPHCDPQRFTQLPRRRRCLRQRAEDQPLRRSVRARPETRRRQSGGRPRPRRRHPQKDQLLPWPQPYRPRRTQWRRGPRRRQARRPRLHWLRRRRRHAGETTQPQRRPRPHPFLGLAARSGTAPPHTALVLDSQPRAPRIRYTHLIPMRLWLPILAVAYLLGSIPFGYILVRIFRKEDIRATGSGNIGATNVARSGKGLGILTLLLDLLKAFAAVRIAQHFAPGTPGFPSDLAVAAGIAAVLGHVFPVWLGFKGGKGVASALGVFIALAPLSALWASSSSSSPSRVTSRSPASSRRL